MESSTTIRQMLAGTKIIVPPYQRAYSWETPDQNTERKTHTDVFLDDIEEYSKSKSNNPYYFGHFLFEEKKPYFYVIDGQQRLTTIVIFLATLFAKLKSIRKLSDDEEISYEDMVKRRQTTCFSTVDYDNQLFRDYVVEQTKIDKNGLETESAQRIVKAFDYFKKKLKNKPEGDLIRMLAILSDATCTTHLVQSESEAIQMFIFQNNRGKKPSNLEIVKAQFMHNVHLYCNQDKDELISEIKNRFETIYKSISSIDYKINEDDILLYTLRVYFNSLREGNALERINRELSDGDQIAFIKEFTRSLAESFTHLSTFFCKHELDNISIHSLITLGGIGIALPFIIKAYKFGLMIDEIGTLCASLEDLVLRHRIIGTRAEIVPRIKDVFENFSNSNSQIKPITDHIDWLKNTTDWWWSYWNNESLKNSLQGDVDHSLAKYLLWKYELHLEEKKGKSGYKPTRFDKIQSPELEHIAPTTQPTKRPHGYATYSKDFEENYLNCLGNYLLLSKSHNCAVGNVPFSDKHKTYSHNEQQREIQTMVPVSGIWNKKSIKERNNKIIRFILENC